MVTRREQMAKKPKGRSKQSEVFKASSQDEEFPEDEPKNVDDEPQAAPEKGRKGANAKKAEDAEDITRSPRQKSKTRKPRQKAEGNTKEGSMTETREVDAELKKAEGKAKARSKRSRPETPEVSEGKGDAETKKAEGKAKARAKRSKPETPEVSEAKEDAEPKKAEGKAKARSKRSKSEMPEVLEPTNQSGGKDDGEQKASVRKRKSEGAEAAESKQPRTWAGRWIPTDEMAARKMFAIKKVFDEFIGCKLKRPSAHQSAFFMVCNSSFKTLPDSSFEEYVARAELQVEEFLKRKTSH